MHASTCTQYTDHIKITIIRYFLRKTHLMNDTYKVKLLLNLIKERKIWFKKYNVSL